MMAHRRISILLALLGLGLAAAFQAPLLSSSRASTTTRGRGALQMAAGDTPVNPDHDILLRVARGERAHRTPVWLMRQVGVCGPCVGLA